MEEGVPQSGDLAVWSAIDQKASLKYATPAPRRSIWKFDVLGWPILASVLYTHMALKQRLTHLERDAQFAAIAEGLRQPKSPSRLLSYQLARHV